MTANELAEAIIKYIYERKNVSFAELSREWPEHFAVKGEDTFDVKMGDYPNIIIWSGLSLIGSNAIDIVMENVEIRPADSLIYLMDGMMLDLPIAKKLKNYKSIRWLPTVIDPPREKKRANS